MQTISPIDPFTAPDIVQARSRFGLLLGSVYRQWRRQIDFAFKDLGLSDATRMPLLILYVQGEALRQKDLADALYLDTSSLVRVLAHLRKAQLVDWASDPADRRTKCIALTPSGRETAKLILAKSMEIERAVLDGHSLQDLETTYRVLGTISRQFSAGES
ncbi:winged helix DNA-binding protein [Alcaligenaceae bacterium]|nr:winged helix DNA-binding protein [Alcaligenaceae bacterium]